MKNKLIVKAYQRLRMIKLMKEGLKINKKTKPTSIKPLHNPNKKIKL